MDTKVGNHVIMASLKSQIMDKLINRTRFTSFDIDKPLDLTSVLEALPGKLDIKRHSTSILYIYENFIKGALVKAFRIFPELAKFLWLL